MDSDKPAHAAPPKPKPATDLEEAVLRHARDHPEDGQARAAQILTRAGSPVSPAGVRYIWRKHGIETAYKRLRALAKTTQGAAALTPERRARLARGETARRLASKNRRIARADDPSWSDDRRAQIVFAAAEQFVRHGFAGASIRDIAAHAGLMAGSVYHYFPSKEDLFVAINQEGFARLTAMVEVAITRGATPRERLELACAAHVAAVIDDHPVTRLTATSLFAIHEATLQHRMRGERRRYETLIGGLVNALTLPAGVSHDVFRLALLGALNWTRVWFKPGMMTPERFAAQLITMTLGPDRTTE